MKKILGIGNALVDALIQIDNDNILKELSLHKGGMTLIEEDTHKKNCKPSKIPLFQTQHRRIGRECFGLCGGDGGRCQLCGTHRPGQ